MVNGEWRRNKTADRAVIALTLISIIAIIAGIIVAQLGQPVGALVAIVTGAVGGIVAIAVQMLKGKDEE